MYTHVSRVNVLTTGLKTHGGGIKKFSEDANDYEVHVCTCTCMYMYVIHVHNNYE